MRRGQITLDGRECKSRVLQLVAETPWMLTHATFNQLVPIALRHARGEKLDSDHIAAVIQNQRTAVTRHARSIGNESGSSSGYSVHGSVARIEITGVIAPYAHMVNSSEGPRGTPVSAIREQLEEAIGDDRVGSILLHMDTPGGNSQSIDLLATEIARAAEIKPVIAYAQGMICSAGYYLASQATRIESATDGTIGSIGTVSITFDFSEQFRIDGVKTIKTASEPLKGASTPGLEVSDEHVAMMQNLVNDVQSSFVDAVARGRGVDPSVVQDQWGAMVWPAGQALELGLIDAITADVRDLVDRMNDEYQPQRSQSSRGLSPTRSAAHPTQTLPAATVAGAIAATAAEPPHTPDGSLEMKLNRPLFDPSPANNPQSAAGGTLPAPAPVAPAPAAPPGQQLSQADLDAAEQRGVQMNQERICEIQSRADALRQLSGNHARMEEHINASISDPKVTPDEFSKRGTELCTELNPPTGHAPSGTSVGAGEDSADKFRSAAELSLIRRSNPGLLDRARGNSDAASQIRSTLGFPDSSSFDRAVSDLDSSVIRTYSVMDLALHSIARREGISRDDARSRYYGTSHSLMSAAFHSASDFPALLANTQNKSLLAMFREQKTFYESIARIGTAGDYKIADLASLSEAPNFKRIPEGGKPDEGGFKDRREQVRVEPWGRAFSWTYQMIRNDDLSAFDRFNQMVAMSASRVPDDALANALALNGGNGPTMSDGLAMFDSAHKNLAATPAALSYEGVRAARRAMASQVGFGEDKAPLEIEARTLLVPTSLMDTADDLVTQEYVPGTEGGNRQKNRLVGLGSKHSSRLDRNSATRWYLFGDPATMPAFEIRFLDGQREPRIERVQDGDPLNYRFYAVIMGFGLSALQYEAAYSNAGA